MYVHLQCVIFYNQFFFLSLVDYSEIFSDFEPTDTSGMFLIIFLEHNVHHIETAELNYTSFETFKSQIYLYDAPYKLKTRKN